MAGREGFGAKAMAPQFGMPLLLVTYSLIHGFGKSRYILINDVPLV